MFIIATDDLVTRVIFERRLTVFLVYHRREQPLMPARNPHGPFLACYHFCRQIACPWWPQWCRLARVAGSLRPDICPVFRVDQDSMLGVSETKGYFKCLTVQPKIRSLLQFVVAQRRLWRAASLRHRVGPGRWTRLWAS